MASPSCDDLDSVGVLYNFVKGNAVSRAHHVISGIDAQGWNHDAMDLVVDVDFIVEF